MTTDSHMGFSDAWDVLTLDNWKRINNEFAVLSTYPSDLGCPQPCAASELCGYTLEVDGMPRAYARGDVNREGPPLLTMNWAAGYAFHRCHADRNVPVDKNLAWIFSGEEMHRAARLWTAGYDLYLP